jgi:hypothetical protein
VTRDKEWKGVVKRRVHCRALTTVFSLLFTTVFSVLFTTVYSIVFPTAFSVVFTTVCTNMEHWRVHCRALTTAAHICKCALTGTHKAHAPTDIFSRSLSLMRKRALSRASAHFAHT